MNGSLRNFSRCEQRVDCVLRSDECTRDAGCSCASVCLEHIAVKMDGALTELLQIKDCTH